MIPRLYSPRASKRPSFATLTALTSAHALARTVRLRAYASMAKRKLDSKGGSESPKRARIGAVEYCAAKPRSNSEGKIIWPAPADAMEAARGFLREWYAQQSLPPALEVTLKSAKAQKKTLIVPDKDADGLSSGVIVHRTLTTLGLRPDLIDVHLLSKGSTIHDNSEMGLMAKKEAKYVVVLDQGSRRSPPIVDPLDTKALIIDHHLSDEFPDHAMVAATCLR